jgi:hypothetical protein
MKATLEFDMNDPDDRKRHLRAVKADEMYNVMFEIMRNMNKRMEHFIESNPNVSIHKMKDGLFHMIRIELDANGIDIDDLE